MSGAVLSGVEILKRGRLAILSIILVFTPFFAVAETATIHLHDGSQLRGELVSLKGGAYTVATESAGTLSIPENQVRVVEYGVTSTGQEASPAGTPVEGSVPASMLEGLQARLLQDPNIMALIESLKSDADVQAIVNDPEIKAAIASGDFMSLLSNPRFQQLMQNPKIRNITEAAK